MNEDGTNTKKQNMVGYLEVRLRVTERSSLQCSGLSKLLQGFNHGCFRSVRRFRCINIGSMESVMKQGNG